jgi:thiamine pyrophosphokinase
VSRAAVVFAGGDPSRHEDLTGLSPEALVIAADSGAVHAVALGWPVHLLVGDLDSVPPSLVEHLEAAGTEVRRHPRAKNHTDLALALTLATEAGVSRVTVVGGHGGRLDHLLANILLLGSEHWAALDVDARMGPSRVTIVRRHRELVGGPGDLVSLVALGGDVEGVTTSGLLFPLQDATLAAGTSQGVSNEMTGPRAAVTVRSGVLAAIQPGERGGLFGGAGGPSS